MLTPLPTSFPRCRPTISLWAGTHHVWPICVSSSTWPCPWIILLDLQWGRAGNRELCPAPSHASALGPLLSHVFWEIPGSFAAGCSRALCVCVCPKHYVSHNACHAKGLASKWDVVNQSALARIRKHISVLRCSGEGRWCEGPASPSTCGADMSGQPCQPGTLPCSKAAWVMLAVLLP